MVFRVRELLIRQRTQAINVLRGHLTVFGQIVPQGAANATRLALANKMARIVWALMARGGVYRSPTATV